MVILLTPCECLQEKLVNFHMYDVKSLFQLGSKDSLGTEFTAVLVRTDIC